MSGFDENQPAVSKLGAIALPPFRLTRPKVGLIPQIPQKDAGMRTEPPVSEPNEKSTNPAATAAAEPDEEPPGSRDGALVFIGVP